MSDMNRRLKKVEKVLNVSQGEPKVAEIVMFCDGELAPDRIVGNVIVREVRYDDVMKRQEQL